MGILHGIRLKALFWKSMFNIMHGSDCMYVCVSLSFLQLWVSRLQVLLGQFASVLIHSINLNIKPGQSSLISALLGEMEKIEGRVVVKVASTICCCIYHIYY